MKVIVEKPLLLILKTILAVDKFKTKFKKRKKKKK